MTTTETLRFPSPAGGHLAARLESPAAPPRAYAVFAHCFTCSKDLKAIRRISRGLAEAGFAVLRFDFTGIGESAGDFAETDFSSNLDDLRAAADFLAGRYEPPALLIGHSLGGAAVLAAAADIPSCRAVATIGAPSDTGHLRDMILQQAPELASRGEAEIQLGPVRFRIKRRLIDDLAEHALRPAIANLDRPLLVFHSPADNVVGVEHARRIFEAARHPKSFISLDDADHLLLSNPRDAAFIASVLAAWASRYIAEEEPPAQRPAASAGEVLVLGGSSGYEQEVWAGGHRLWADEPEDAGGADRGPTPYGLLLAGLGACTSMTLRMYADRKDWPLRAVHVRLRHSKVHADDCADCETKQGRIDIIDRAITLHGDLDNRQRQRLLEIAERCPVHHTLTSETRIRSRLDDA